MPNITAEALRGMNAGGGMPAAIAALAPLATGKNPDGTDFIVKTAMAEPIVSVSSPAVAPSFFIEATAGAATVAAPLVGATHDAKSEFRALSSGSAAHVLLIEGSSDGATWVPYGEVVSTVKGTAAQSASLTVYPAAAFVRARVYTNLAAVSALRLTTATL